MFNKIARKKVTKCLTKQPESHNGDYMFNKIARKKVTKCLPKQPERK